MKKYFLFSATILVIAFFKLSCRNSNRTVPVSPGGKEMVVVRPTPDHVRVPNSHLYIVPPPGFVPDTVTSSIVKHADNNYSSDFMQMTIYAGKTAGEYLAEIKAQSEKIQPGSWKEETLTINGHFARLCQYLSMEGMRQAWLYFTDGYTSEMLIANWASKDSVTGKEISAAMKTVLSF